MTELQNKHLVEMKTLLIENGCEIINILSKSEPMEYKCKCGEIIRKTFRDFKRRNCLQCKKLLQQKESVVPECPDIVEDTGEIWRRTLGGWISSFGRAKNLHGKLLNICPTKFRYHLNNHHQYASRLVAIAFKIPDYEKILDGTQKFCVSHRDND